ncbi:MAG: PilW family protein [Burkholderiales bacterium]|jgi:type IV pilus assembly protein PilW|nr:PilW family protein [Burkholderiales bacterium]
MKRYWVHKQHGFTLIEILVALVIGLLSIYAVYTVYEGSEQAKRNITAVGDAQVSGLYAVFLMTRELSNAGASIASNGTQLSNCAEGDTLLNSPGSDLSLRPVPALIRSNAGLAQIEVFYGDAVALPVSLTVNNVIGGVDNQIIIEAPTGIMSDSVLVFARGGNCAVYRVLPSGGGLINPPDMTTNLVTVRLDGVPTSVAANDDIIVLGTQPIRRHFYVDASGTLQMQEWRFTSAAAGWEYARTDSIVANVVAFNAQYGVDNNNDGAIDSWRYATDGFSFDTVRGAPLATLRTIKAVRIGIVIRADEPDREFKQGFTKTFFTDCPPAGTCDSQFTFTQAALPPDAPFGWRYRAYETVIPLKNVIWN